MNKVITLKKSTPTTSSQSRNPFISLKNEIDRTISDFYHLFEPSFGGLESFGSMGIAPAIDIVEDNQNFKIEAEMPGLSEDEIKVTISDGTLTIMGEKTTSSKDEGKNYLKREISYGRYERSISLPESIDIDKAKASFKKGMLWINFPKRTQGTKKPRELRIEKATK